MGTKTVLVIAKIFPPAGGAGVQRTAKFVKYLPHFGWEPIVLTPNRITSPMRDDSLLRDIPPNTRIIRTFTLEPMEEARRISAFYFLYGALRVLSIPDLSIWWVPWGIWHGYRELRRKAVDAIYVTGSPFSSYFIGVALKKLTGIPLVVDFRDGWTLDPNYNFWWVLRWRNPTIERLMQDAVVRYADKLIVAHPGVRDIFMQRYGAEKAFVTILNGYDPDDFRVQARKHLERDRLNIVYTGKLWPLTSRPDALLRGVKRVLEEDADIRKDLSITFVGNLDQHSQALIRELGLERWVRTVGYLPHLESVEHLLEADVLLLIVNHCEFHIPGKIYEYIAARKPVLALVTPNGEAARLLKKAGSEIWADPQDVLDIRDKLRLLHRRWKDNDLDIEVNSEFIETLSRKRQTGLLASVLDEVASSSSPQDRLRRD